MSRRCSEYTAIKVDGKWYRAERYDYRSCSEVLIRGDFPNGVFHPDGRPVFKKGHITAFKLVNSKPQPINRNRSKKTHEGDPDSCDNWVPFWEAYA